MLRWLVGTQTCCWTDFLYQHGSWSVQLNPNSCRYHCTVHIVFPSIVSVCYFTYNIIGCWITALRLFHGSFNYERILHTLSLFQKLSLVQRRCGGLYQHSVPIARFLSSNKPPKGNAPPTAVQLCHVAK